MTHDLRPLRLAIVDDYAVVVAGVAAFPADERIDVVETAASQPVLSDVDVVLYDTFGQVRGQGLDLEDFVRDNDARVVVYSWNSSRRWSRRRSLAEPVVTFRRFSPDRRLSPRSGGSWPVKWWS